jgi:hypothetical protein
MGSHKRSYVSLKLREPHSVTFSELFDITSSTLFGILSRYGRARRIAEEARRLAMERFRLLRPHLE